jgi:Beta protein
MTKASWFQSNDYGWGNENIRDVASAGRGKGNNTDWVAFTTQVHLAAMVKQVRVAVRAAAAQEPAPESS